MDAKQWLTTYAPGFRELVKDDLETINNFLLLWGLFEAEALNNQASTRKICELVTNWHRDGILQLTDFAETLTYFKKRYFVDGSLTYYFNNLRLRPNDCPDLVRAVIKDENTDEKDSVIALLIIICRLRNNLFHGEKWAFGIQGQRVNFAHANVTLMKVLEIAGIETSRKLG